MSTCPSENTDILDQSSFWDSNGVHWDSHRIGWAIAGGTAALTVLITLFSIFTHARNYHNRNEQRQIIRILYMPAVYAIISFFSFRFFRDYTYYSLVEVVYEAVTLSAFMLLLIEYVGSTATAHKAENAMLRKDKQPLPFPFCYWRYRPTKPYFMYAVKWSVMQYTIVSPLLCIVGIVCQSLNVLCREVYSVHFAQVYITAVDFTTISVALYGLILFYGLTKDELAGRKPLAKFLCIKGIVMLTFYQEFVFSTLEKYHLIKGNNFWTATNVADGLNALTICIEMVFFAAAMLYSYPASEYKSPGLGTTNIIRPIIDSLNPADFISEIYLSLKFFIDYARGKPNTHSIKQPNDRTDFGEAFGLYSDTPKGSGINSGVKRVPSDEEYLGNDNGATPRQVRYDP